MPRIKGGANASCSGVGGRGVEVRGVEGRGVEDRVVVDVHSTGLHLTWWMRSLCTSK